VRRVAFGLDPPPFLEKPFIFDEGFFVLGASVSPSGSIRRLCFARSAEASGLRKTLHLR
jgi:hypothetical protein